MEELWMPIPSFNGIYEASSIGRVRSMYHASGKRKGILRDEPRLVKSHANNYGYIGVHLSHGKYRTIHDLVLESFIGKRPIGLQCAHLNGKRSDNRIENLAWVTCKENHRHLRLHGTVLLGSRNPSAKLDEKNVLIIKRLLTLGIPMTQIAGMYGVTRTTIQKIRDGLRWTHVEALADKEEK
jgi:hypothetical protein